MKWKNFTDKSIEENDLHVEHTIERSRNHKRFDVLLPVQVIDVNHLERLMILNNCLRELRESLFESDCSIGVGKEIESF